MGKLVYDDFAGYKAGFEQGITEIGCMAHARRKFFDLHAANKNQVAEQALHSIAGLYEVERQVPDMSDEECGGIRQGLASPLLDALHAWVLAQRDRAPSAKALGYSLELAGTDSLCRGWCGAHRQQPDREPDPAAGPWTLELVVCRVATQRQTGGGDHEPDSVGVHERA